MDLKRYDEALECFNKVLKLDPDAEKTKRSREKLLSKMS
jgi:tetratricopeptide (TPR) repeat protein